jgi:hypothetical protein
MLLTRHEGLLARDKVLSPEAATEAIDGSMDEATSVALELTR